MYYGRQSLKFMLVQAVMLAGSAYAQPPEIDFTSQIKPLLSDRCFLCHGPDGETRQAGLRLDSPDSIQEALESDPSRKAIVPGHADQSAVVERILETDPDLVMPPVDSGLSLDEEEKQLIVRWIEQGAQWQQHWSFRPIVSPDVPTVKNQAWCANDIDHFVMAKRETQAMPVTSMAGKETLIRRLTFDLTGLPPTLQEIDQFLADETPDAYSKLVDRLLASEHFGERLAAEWLDVARYSDTYGYQVDRDRFVWPWRDWVIRAFNQNMPYDQFITEQLAGDLLDSPTKDQILATTFNRLHPQKVEGGSVPEEFRVEYVADRTQTVATAFMGLTFECARCHDHKYDPLTQREYYQLFSFFNNIDEAGLYSYFTNSVPTPTLQLTNEQQDQQLSEAQATVNTAEAEFAALYQQEINSTLKRLQEEARPESAEAAVTGEVARLSFETNDGIGANRLATGRGEQNSGQCVQLTGDHGIDVKAGNFPRWKPFTVSLWMNVPRAYERAVVFHRSRAWTDAASRGYELLIEDGHLSAALIHFWPGNAIRVRSASPLPLNTWTHVSLTWDGSSRAAGLQLWVNGELAETEVVRDNLYRNVTGGGGDTINIGQRFRDTGLAGGLVDDFRVFDRRLSSLELRDVFDGESLQRVSTLPADQLPADQRQQLAEWLVDSQSTTVAQQREALEKQRESLCKLQDGLQEIMVMKEMPNPRPSFVLTRGAYDAHGAAVTAEVPASLPALTDDMPHNRLGLAQWLTAPEHPLTARVTVNRIWQLCFGEGLVRTPEDFGSQGASPSHPQLLDYLAARFIREGWDVKSLMKFIMLSSTYRQTSETTAEVRQKDPLNLLLSRSPVFRLSAEMLRDNSLAVSGLLVDRIGGPPVRPYELEASFKPSTPDSGEGLYRRSVYTYWKRTAPAPMMMTLDASKRDVCRMRRERTTSPLQSLVVLNGPQFVEAARALAFRLISKHEEDESAIAVEMFRLLTSRAPDETEHTAVLQLFQQQKQHFQSHQDAASKYLGVGGAKTETSDPVVLAAWTSVANTLLALDECMVRR